MNLDVVPVGSQRFNPLIINTVRLKGDHLSGRTGEIGEEQGVKTNPGANIQHYHPRPGLIPDNRNDSPVTDPLIKEIYRFVECEKTTVKMIKETEYQIHVMLKIIHEPEQSSSLPFDREKKVNKGNIFHRGLCSFQTVKYVLHFG
jgi:hypothetical protein